MALEWQWNVLSCPQRWWKFFGGETKISNPITESLTTVLEELYRTLLTLIASV